MPPSLPIRWLLVSAVLHAACSPTNSARSPTKDGAQDLAQAHRPTRIVLQPGPADGKDTFIHSGSRSRRNNYGNRIELTAGAWTAGDPFVLHGLFDFNLSSVPAKIRIHEARLALHAELTSMMWRMGNNQPPGHSTLSGSNTFSLRRVTSPWQESTVSWDTKPSTTPVDEVVLPASKAPDQNYLDIDVTGLVQTMLDDPQNSHGFSLQLVTEDPYRQVIFASSDHPDATLRPRLEIVLEGGE
ncbi:DNRLRE domain-containing protein [Hyalangium versicolor]|uniref:DNRLRE domain-containing protein n=1 Tax=Hyalangium versicolor TaxID=2861190 RepID=UPI001CCC5DD0|nr:DNRLRE domain-containing protein [Hyalangium versicolor]